MLIFIKKKKQVNFLLLLKNFIKDRSILFYLIIDKLSNVVFSNRRPHAFNSHW